MAHSRVFLAVLGLLLPTLGPPPSLAEESPSKRRDMPGGTRVLPDATQQRVSFETEDGWTLHGTYSVPNSHAVGDRSPAALLLHAETHTQAAWVIYPGWVGIQASIPTLRIDWRGRGDSQGATPFVRMSKTAREGISLDVAAAIDFLAAQPEVDSRRIAIVAEGYSVEPALLGGLGDPRVPLYLLISGMLSERALERIEENPEPRIRFVVSDDDREALKNHKRAHKRAGNSASELRVYEELGVGIAMASVWRNRNPDRPEENAPDYVLGRWLVETLEGFGSIREVVLNTPDGWELHANLGLPARTPGEPMLPGIVLLPTALSDRSTYHAFEKRLLRHDIAFLNLEWRGTGKSTNRGHLIDLPVPEIRRGLEDIQQGLRFLASQPEVDPARIGVMGAALSSKLSLFAAGENPSIKALALLSPLVWERDETLLRKAAEGVAQPTLLVTGRGFGALTAAFGELIGRSERNRVIRYSGSRLAPLMLKRDPEIAASIVAWFEENL